METMDAMVDSWIKLSGMLKTMVLLWNQPIHTEELADHADTLLKIRLGLFLTVLMLLLLKSKLLLLPLLNNQSQLPLKPTIYHSNFTKVVFIQAFVELDWITVFSLLDTDKKMERNTTELRTLGEPHGDLKVTFWSKETETEKENVESKKFHHSQLLEFDIIIQPLIVHIF